MKQAIFITLCASVFLLSQGVSADKLSIPPATGTISIPTYNFALDTVNHMNKVKQENEAREKARQEAVAKAAQEAIEAQKQAEQARLAAQTPQAVTAPVQAPQTGCVLGYKTGNYALDQIISHESGGNSCITNGGGCFGLLQACPGYPLQQACGGDPDCQIAWFQANKTGGRSWDTIWALWQTQGWW